MFDNTGKALDALRLPTDQRADVIARLAEKSRARPTDRRRAARRFRVATEQGITIQVNHPGGTDVALRIYPRDLSELGMGFLHGSFLYPGSSCTIYLRTKRGQPAAVRGKLVRCDLIKGRIHDVGMEFDQPLDVTDFADIQEVSETNAPTDGDRPLERFRRDR